MCGEQRPMQQRKLRISGSPPRVRGTAKSPSIPSRVSGITPACAGNSAGSDSRSGKWRDHPRVCGEQHPNHHHRKEGEGSPPRVRGTAFLLGFLPGRIWITPACAGNSHGDGRKNPGTKDHPRVCGEQAWAALAWRDWWGSPPRVRGTVGESKEKLVQNRITPACAGNRAMADSISVMASDHPRVCGEQPMSSISTTSVSGSPPRVRGTAIHTQIAGKSRRITPACAGNSAPISRRWRAPWDHPRVCGEQPSRARTPCRSVGSPPRVRGTDIFLPLYSLCSRITPACAGNSFLLAPQ